MKRMFVVLAVFALVAAACTAGGDEEPTAPPTVNPTASQEPVTLELWSAWTSNREIRQFDAIFQAFEEQYPWITVEDTGGIGDQKLIQAINSGTAPDAVLSFGLDNVGKFCASGAWQDLTPYMEQSSFDTSQFPDSIFQYTSFGGSQCALPFLTDVYGLYYNVDMFEAGIIDPTKVVRLALENAVSVAGVLLLSEATLTELPEAKPERTPAEEYQ